MNNQLTTISTLSNQSLETILENGAYKSQSTKDKIRLWMPIALRALNLGATNKKCQYSLNDLMQQNNLTLFAEFNYGSLNGKMRTVYNA
jgi:hypothetical protein